MFVFFFQAEDGIRDRTGDWSSDVCSSDLTSMKFASISGGFKGNLNFELIEKFPWGTPLLNFQNFEAALCGSRATQDDEKIGRASCRERV